MRARFSRCFRATRTLSLLLITTAALLGFSAEPASAQSGTCLQDQYAAAGNTQNLNCTANDVSIAAVTGVTIISGGVGNKCIAGQPFTFVADFEILTTSKSSRSNIGLYFGTGTGSSQNGALSGVCTDAVLSPTYQCTGDPSVTCGDPYYKELDANEPSSGSPIGCGDTSSTDTSTEFGAGTQAAEIEVVDAMCPSTGTTLSLPECTSWQVPGKTLLCETTSPNYLYPYNGPNGTPTAVPGSPSKCSCGTLSIPVQPIQPGASASKSCNTTLSTGTGLTSCDAGPEGSTVTYTVTINNTTPANEGGIVVDQICDNRYGTIFDDGKITTACPAGTKGSIVSGSASSCATLAANPITTSGSCTFQAVQGENDSVTDTVTVNGESSLSSGTFFPPAVTNTVTVTSSDAPSTATVTKGLIGTDDACATVTYSVNVHNTSGADENLSLSALHDTAFGDLTKLGAGGPGTVLGTTCGVAIGSKGLGSMSNITASATNGGALPYTLSVGGSDYQCQFDAEFCGQTGPVEQFGTGVCTAGFCSNGLPSSTSCSKNSDCDTTCPVGITHTNTVTPTMTGDEGETVTIDSHTFTVNECLASFTRSSQP